MRTTLIAAILCLGGLLQAQIHYVVPPGTVGVTPTAGYTTWETAATSVNDAVAVATAGAEVRVAPGTYILTNQIYVSNGITLRSWNNGELDPERTILDGNYPLATNRCVFVTNATVRGFTITRGSIMGERQQGSGGGAQVEQNGILSDCLITGNHAEANGGGVYMIRQSLVSNCVISANTATNSGGGAFMTGRGLLTHSKIIGNRACLTTVSERGGGGVQADANAMVYSCIIASNSSAGPGTVRYGGGCNLSWGGKIINSLVYANSGSNRGNGVTLLFGGLMENCTVVDHPQWGVVVLNNTEKTYILNSIVYDSVLADIRRERGTAESIFISNCCYQASSGFQQDYYGEGNFHDNPQFANPDVGDYRLLASSPCIDRGIYADWMVGATDLKGDRRVYGVAVDAGCYEFAPLGSMIFLR